MMQKPIPDKPFELMRWFRGLSSVVIVCIAIAHALLISSFLSTHLFQREGELSRDFVQNILVADGSLNYLSNPDDPVLAGRFANTVQHIQNMHDLLRANIYRTDGTVVWSSDPQLIGHKFTDENEELDEALKGELVVNPAHISEWLLEKKEHVGIDPVIKYFVECYIPVVDPVTNKVIGVVEFYRAPVALSQAIVEGQIQVWFTALGSAIVLFLTLYWIVRRADATIKRQHSRLVETETLAVVGELTASVAHNIRNPLSSIRSSAELALESPKDDCTEQAKDIIHEVDRIGKQISELLNYSAENIGQPTDLDPVALIERCVSEHQPAFERLQQSLALSSTIKGQPKISGDSALLQQVFHSLISNASEAMGAGGICAVRISDEAAKSLCIEIEDGGKGIPPEIRSLMFRPFYTTKPKGLGLGLPQARKIIERFGGSIEFLDNPGKGALVKIVFPRA